MHLRTRSIWSHVAAQRLPEPRRLQHRRFRQFKTLQPTALLL